MCDGITLRDLFAAFCAAGVHANSHDEIATMTHKAVAEYCYRGADALLAQREADSTEGASDGPQP
jgi:hypothetical protein